MGLAAWLERVWYGRSWARFLLAPLALVFGSLAAIRRQAYAFGLLPVARPAVPVIVVGNITVGGTGKTPLVIWLAKELRAAGLRPGVISRGYGGHAEGAVTGDSDPARYGDEPVLIARRVACPVWVGRRRGEVAKALLAAHPEVDVLIADDGLQHYALARDVEIVVLDGSRGLGNGWRLPAGPLREPPSRLARVDAVVVNGGTAPLGLPVPTFGMRLVGAVFESLGGGRRVGPEHFRGRRLTAIAGIGNPERFFAHLRGLGLSIQARPYPDHHDFKREELPAGTLIMTEKDAVKCARLGLEDAWFLRVDAELKPGLKELVLDAIGRRHGPEAS